MKRCCFFCKYLRSRPTGKCTNSKGVTFGQQIMNTGTFKCKYFEERTRGTY